jgi:Bacterial archaeo-eukaryotic release factor family 2
VAADTLLDEIRSVYERSGGVATVYLPAGSATEDLADRLRMSWKDARRSLEVSGAPSGALDALDDAVAQSTPAAGTRCLVAADGDVVFDVQLDPELPRVAAWWDRLPRLVPVLEWRQSLVPFVIVRIDRVGADIVGVELAHVVAEATTEGEELDITRSKPGGWSQRRFQQRAENRWESNAKAVAGEVSDVADRVDAELIVVAGDVRAVGFLEEHLPERWKHAVREVPGGRDDTTAEAVAEHAATLVADVAARHTAELLRRRSDSAAGGRAVDGPDAVLAALGERRVETLLVPRDAEDPDAEPRRAWSSPDGTMVGATPDAISATAQTPVEGPLVDTAVRAAFVTGADVHVVPHTTVDGLAAILRF